MKQEISAIREAIDNRRRGIYEPVRRDARPVGRYKELMKLPEAELAKGVSIDDYSTYRATRFSEPV